MKVRKSILVTGGLHLLGLKNLLGGSADLATTEDDESSGESDAGDHRASGRESPLLAMETEARLSGAQVRVLVSPLDTQFAPTKRDIERLGSMPALGELSKRMQQKSFSKPPLEVSAASGVHAVRIGRGVRKSGNADDSSAAGSRSSAAESSRSVGKVGKSVFFTMKWGGAKARGGSSSSGGGGLSSSGGQLAGFNRPSNADRRRKEANRLICAVVANDKQKVMGLLEHNGDPNAKESSIERSGTAVSPGMSAFYVASVCLDDPDLTIAKILLEKGAEVNCHNSDRSTPLVGATVHNKIDSLRWLLENGANPDEADDEGDTALHYAAQLGRRDIVKVLLKCDADPNAVNACSQSPLFDAIEQNQPGCETIVSLLLAAGAKQDVVNCEGCTLLQMAKKKGNVAVLARVMKIDDRTDARQEKVAKAQSPVGGRTRDGRKRRAGVAVGTPRGRAGGSSY
jgi:ankyrin repeat protein